jgi:hypothetical protein
MTTHYRTTDGSPHDLTPAQFAALQGNGKAALLRLWLIDAQAR